MDHIVMPPPQTIFAIAALFDSAIARFIVASASTPPLGRFESEVESKKLLILVIRNIESLLVIAKTDLVLLPSAYVLARAVLEIGVKAAWIVEPEDPFQREV